MELYVQNNTPTFSFILLKDGTGNPDATIYDDRTNDIESWYLVSGRRYKLARDYIKSLVLVAANSDVQNPTFDLWNSGLTQTQRNIAIEMIVCPYALRVPTITDEEDAANWRNLIIRTEGSQVQKLQGRSRIVEEMRICVGNYIRLETLTIEKGQDFYRDVKLHLQDYIASNAPDLKWWITNEVGTAYENNGFFQTEYYSASLKNDLMDIYNGNW